jgi:hypothetical protein
MNSEQREDEFGVDERKLFDDAGEDLAFELQNK